MNIHFNNIYNYNKDTFGENIYGDAGGDIYIIKTDYSVSNYFKIGKTKNLIHRMAQYRCGSVFEPRLYYYYPFNNIQDIDEKLKSILLEYQLKNEIYHGNIDTFRKIIINLQKETGNKILEYEPIIKDSCCHLTLLNVGLKIVDKKRFPLIESH